jgi:MobA/MobL family
MAHYHCTVRAGAKGRGALHAQYIAREGRFKAEKYGEIGEHEAGNLPEWARGSPARFFARADDHELATGNSYREFEMALPIEFSDAERVRLVREFVAEQIGEDHAYRWAIHEPRGHNPHVHVMYSERTIDEIERDEEQYFMRANRKHPELGGCLKSDRFTGKGGPKAVLEIRERWAEMQNEAYERLGFDVRVDHRSLADQGLEREPGMHRGPAISGIEERGEVSEVTQRRAAERALERENVLERQPDSLGLMAEMREVSREEVAAAKLCARERRELLPEATGELRDELRAQVEADRREQILRLQAQAERRIERRRELSMAAQIKEKLLEQARSLRDRLGKELERVKEWVEERFIQPIQKIKEHTRGMFEGLNLSLESSPAAAEKPASQNKAQKDLDRALDRYAKAWGEVAQMQEQNVPVLEHQKIALRDRRQALENLWPDAGEDLRRAMVHEKGAYESMRDLTGKERTQAMREMLEHEQTVRADPNLRAQRMVKQWQGLEETYEATRGWQHQEQHQQVRDQMKDLALEFKRDPQLESLVKSRRQEFGIERGSGLDRLLDERNLKRAIEISLGDRSRDHGLSL